MRERGAGAGCCAPEAEAPCSVLLAAPAVSGFFFFRDAASDSFELLLRFCERSLVEPIETSQDFALLPVLRVSEASSFEIDFLREGGGAFDWTGFTE